MCGFGARCITSTVPRLCWRCVLAGRVRDGPSVDGAVAFPDVGRRRAGGVFESPREGSRSGQRPRGWCQPPLDPSGGDAAEAADDVGGDGSIGAAAGDGVMDAPQARPRWIDGDAEEPHAGSTGDPHFFGQGGRSNRDEMGLVEVRDGWTRCRAGGCLVSGPDLDTFLRRAPAHDRLEGRPRGIHPLKQRRGPVRPEGEERSGEDQGDCQHR